MKDYKTEMVSHTKIRIWHSSCIDKCFNTCMSFVKIDNPSPQWFLLCGKEKLTHFIFPYVTYARMRFLQIWNTGSLNEARISISM